MKTRYFLFIAALSVGLAHRAEAACTLALPCQTPAAGAITGNTITTISANVRNSATATPNDTNSLYYFEATTAGAPSTVQDPVSGTVVFVAVQYLGAGNVIDTIAGQIKPVVGGTTYNIFVRACPAGQSVSHANCSAWLNLGSRATTAYPSNAGFPNVISANTLPRGFTALTAGVQDAVDVLAWQVQINNNDVQLAAGNSGFLSQQPFSGQFNGGNGTFAIDQTDYAGLLPNVRYNLTERLLYFYNQFGPSFTTGNFFTQAADPVAVSVTNVTHCSAQLNYQNAAANPANPEDTTYSLAIGGPVSAGAATQTQVIGGTGVFSDANSVSFMNLQAGTNYSPTATAINRGGAAWRNSNPDAFTAFNTVAWGGTFSVPAASIGTTSADFVASAVNTAGVQSWVLISTPFISGLPSGNAANVNGTHAMTGLVPNTPYTVSMRITEASGCFSQLPVGSIAFTSDAAIPQTFNLTASATNARRLDATWTTNGNSAATTYQIEYCTDPGFAPASCLTQTTAANATSAAITTGVLPETTYFAHVRALAASGGTTSAYSNSGSATTINEAPSIVSGPTFTLHLTSGTLRVTATDNASPSALTFAWTVNASPTGNPTLTSASGSTTINGNNATNVTQLTFTQNGNYSGTLTVRDHSGGAGNMATVVNWNTGGVSQVPTFITVTPANATVVTGGNQVFNAIVCDQFETAGNCNASSTHIISGQSVNWSVNGGGTRSPASGASTTFTASTPGTGFILTASLPTASNGTATINVVAAGPFFVNQPTLVPVAPNYFTGTLSALGNDNVGGEASLTYTWSLESGPAPVSVSPNGTNGAKNSVATFSRAGAYVLRCTISNVNGSAFALTASANVLQVLSGLTVCPAGASVPCATSITLKTLENQQFVAYSIDQFGGQMATPSVNWSLSGPGTISASGVFQSNSIGQQVTVTATPVSGGQSGAILVNLVSFDVSNAKAFPVPWKASQGIDHIRFDNLGSNASIHIYTTSGRLVFETRVSNPSYDWNVKNISGESIASGVYFYVIESPEGKKNGKLIIIK